jgi:hypothetical protein
MVLSSLLISPLGISSVFVIENRKDGYFVGVEKTYDISASKLSKWSSALGFATSYYRKISSDTELTAKVAGATKSLSDVTIEVGAKHALDADSFVKVKTDNLGRLGLGYTQILRPGFKVSIGGLFDTTRLSENVHKVGISLTVDV